MNVLLAGIISYRSIICLTVYDRIRIVKTSSIEAASFAIPVLMKLVKKEDFSNWRLRSDQLETRTWINQLGLKIEDIPLVLMMFDRGQKLVRGEEDSAVERLSYILRADESDWVEIQRAAVMVAIKMMSVDKESLEVIRWVSEDESGARVGEVLGQIGVNLDWDGVEAVRQALKLI